MPRNGVFNWTRLYYFFEYKRACRACKVCSVARAAAKVRDWYYADEKLTGEIDATTA